MLQTVVNCCRKPSASEEKSMETAAKPARRKNPPPLRRGRLGLAAILALAAFATFLAGSIAGPVSNFTAREAFAAGLDRLQLLLQLVAVEADPAAKVNMRLVLNEAAVHFTIANHLSFLLVVGDSLASSLRFRSKGVDFIRLHFVNHQNLHGRLHFLDVRRQDVCVVVFTDVSATVRCDVSLLVLGYRLLLCLICSRPRTGASWRGRR